MRPEPVFRSLAIRRGFTLVARIVECLRVLLRYECIRDRSKCSRGITGSVRLKDQQPRFYLAIAVPEILARADQGLLLLGGRLELANTKNIFMKHSAIEG